MTLYIKELKYIYHILFILKNLFYYFEMDMNIFSNYCSDDQNEITKNENDNNIIKTFLPITIETTHTTDQLSISNYTTSKIVLPLFQCSICQKQFHNKTALRKHTSLHLNLRKYKCDKCNKAYKRSDHLTRHMLTHNETSKNTFQCPFCDFCFSLKYHLKSHLNNIHLLNPYKFKCEYCDEYFPKKIKLLKHSRAMHKDKIQPKKISCYYPYCFKSYLTQHSLDKHIEKVHSGQNNKNNNSDSQSMEDNLKKEKEYFKCSYDNCFKTYSTMFNLNTHIKSFHLKLKSFLCGTCQMAFSHKSSLKRHLLREKHKMIEEENNNVDCTQMIVDEHKNCSIDSIVEENKD